MWKAKINPVTSLKELVGSSVVKSINDELRTNSKGTNYVLGTVEIEISGAKKIVPCAIYEKNLAHGIEVGNKYLTTLSKGEDGKVYCQVSHLSAAEAISADEFDAHFEALEATPAATTEAETVTVM